MEIKAPRDFTPEDAEINPKKVPPVRSRYRKSDLCGSDHHFQDIDNHAIQVADTDHDNFTDFIWHLVYSINLQSDLQKTRAIFRWMTARNISSISFKKGVKPGSPEEVLTSVKNKKGTFARIFETICRFCGVTAVVLTGFAKGKGYRPGDRCDEPRYNHSWNAVLIDSNWYLVDTHWATRYISMRDNDAPKLVYEYEYFYFLTDPEQLIYSHWPHKKEWQLLDQPVELSQFENLPLVMAPFFRCGMYFHSHHKGVVYANRGRIAVTVGHIKPIHFSYKIEFATSGENSYNGLNLKHYAVHYNSQQRTQTVVFRAPKAGHYYFTFLASLQTEGMLNAACEYKVVAEVAAPNPVPVPLCKSFAWGACMAAEQLGLVARTTDGIITTENGRVKLEFQKVRPVHILCTLRRNGMAEEDLKKYVNVEDTGDSVQVTTTFPSRGEYGLEMYATDPDKNDGNYRLFSQHYIHYATIGDHKQAFYQECPEQIVKESAGHRASAEETTKVRLRRSDSNKQQPLPSADMVQMQYLYGTIADSRQRRSKRTSSFRSSKVMYVPGTGPSETPLPGTGQTDIAKKRLSAELPTASASTLSPTRCKSLEVKKRTAGQDAPAAPAEFRLVTVTKVPGEIQPPVPGSAPQQKPTVEAIDQLVLHSLDDHATQVSQSNHQSFRDLVWDLVYSKNITNEIEKARLLFHWLASKDPNEMKFEQEKAGIQENVLMGLKTGATTYAEIFDILCKYAELPSQIISGYAKGSEYRPGMKFQPGHNQHTWNAVIIRGVWCLVDSQWAARRPISKEAQTDEECRYQLDDFYFLPDPSQLICTHFPDDPAWQLLNHPVTLAEFENMPYTKSQFFRYGLEFVTHRTGVILSRGETDIRFRYPAHKISLAFNIRIRFENGDEKYKGIQLKRFGLIDLQGGIASFSIRLPVSGSYMLFIFAKEDVAEKTENVYFQVCEYKIEHEAVPGSPPEPYPPCSSLTWGPGSAFYRYGLSTYQQSPVMYTRDGKAELQIRQSRPMQYKAKLKHNDVGDVDLDAYAMHRVVGNTVFFNVIAPGRGEFGLEINANDPATEDLMFNHVAQYLLICKEDVNIMTVSTLPTGYLGAQPKFSEFGMVAASHPDPIIHLDNNFVVVVLKCKIAMRVMASLLSAEEEKEYPDLTFIHTKESENIIKVSLPQTGFFKLQIYGSPRVDKDQELPSIFNYLIDCRGVTQNVFPFPKQFALWREGCFMAEPDVIIPAKNLFGQPVPEEVLPEIVNFCVTVPGAKSVAAVVDQKWTHLQRGNGDQWSGKVKIGPYYNTDTKLVLQASYDSDHSSYTPLLEYTL